MSKPFNVANWYWLVTDQPGLVYSSARGVFVPLTDPTYVAWGSDGTIPTVIPLTSDLGQVLALAQVRPQHAGLLDAYTQEQARNIITHVAFKIAFNHENRLRAVERALSLNGSPANLTPAQALAAVKALM